jgi:hypothetical protein
MKTQTAPTSTNTFFVTINAFTQMKQETLLAVTSQLQACTHNYHVSTPANQEQQH